MELYIDESGNTGGVITKKGQFNFYEQSHFVLCAVKVKDDNDKSILIKKYQEFKKEFNICGEVKGSDLMTRNCNKELDYFIDNILDDEHFEICVYDKKFYLSTLLLLFIMGNEFQSDYPVIFYILADEITFECEDLLKEYCEFSKNPTYETFKHFLEVIIMNQYGQIPTEKNPLIIIAKQILNNKNFDYWLNSVLTYGSYENLNYINLINLNALSELIMSLKWHDKLKNKSLKIYHDKIDGYDKTIISELIDLDFCLEFVDSKEEVLIQIADNAVSIFTKCINQSIKQFELEKEWEIESQWIMEKYAKILEKIGSNKIKFTIPTPNWALSLCIGDMFNKEYPVTQRNNIYFNEYYNFYINKIRTDISLKDFSAEFSNELLKQ